MLQFCWTRLRTWASMRKVGMAGELRPFSEIQLRLLEGSRSED